MLTEINALNIFMIEISNFDFGKLAVKKVITINLSIYGN